MMNSIVITYDNQLKYEINWEQEKYIFFLLELTYRNKDGQRF